MGAMRKYVPMFVYLALLIVWALMVGWKVNDYMERRRLMEIQQEMDELLNGPLPTVVEPIEPYVPDRVQPYKPQHVWRL